MTKVEKAFTLGALIKAVFMLFLSLVIFIVVISIALLLTYGALEYVSTGENLVEAVDKLVENSDWEIMQVFGERIFGAIPFADVLNAVFITHVTPDLTTLFPDVVTAVLAGLLFFVIARLNIVLGKVIKSRILFGTIVAIMTVVSICLAMIVTTWMSCHLEGVVLVVARCSVFVLSILVHALLLFITLKGMRFFRVLFSILLDSVVGIFNNIFLWFCSFFFMDLLRSTGLPGDSIFIYTLVGIFAIYGLYSIIMDKITSTLWFLTA